MAGSASGKAAAFSARRQGFDSPTRCEAGRRTPPRAVGVSTVTCLSSKQE
jgi:hypothetical protein